MKNPIVILAIIVLILGGLLWYQTDSKNEYKDKYDNLKETQSIKIKDTLNSLRIETTDGLVKVHKSKPDSIKHNQINRKYENKIDSLRGLNDIQFNWYIRSINKRYGLDK